MKRTIALAALLLFPALVAAQESRVYTRPTPLSREALERLHLKQAWRALVPIGDRRDGVYSVQFMGDQIIVQTRAGVVAALNPADGRTQWRTQVGLPYRVNHPLGANNELLFATRGTFLYALNRKTGTQMWEYDLPGSPSSPPTADDDNVYVSTGVGRLLVYELPRKKKAAPDAPPEAPAEPNPKKYPDTQPSSSPYSIKGPARQAVGPLSSARQVGSGWSAGPQPELLWEFKADARIEQAPILTDNHMVLASVDGTFLVSSKFQRHIPFSFKAGSGLAAPLGCYAWRIEDGTLEENVFVAMKDYNLYALDVNRAKIIWRVTGAAPIHRKPEVTDEDVYMVADGAGMYRINRKNGDTVWRNAKAVQYLASNKKFVYATDRGGRMLILDRARGTEQAQLDISAYTVPISNEFTDRIYLATTDGQLVCLHDRDFATPQVMKTLPPPKPPEKKPGEGEAGAGDKKPEDKKPADKEDKEDKKDKEDKEDKGKDKEKAKDKEKDKDKDN